MKIGVNARFLVKPFTGIGQYTKNLFAELAQIMPNDEFVLLVPENVDIKLPKNIKVEVLEEKRRGGSGMRKTWWEQVQVPEFLKQEAVDVAFFPYPCNPWPKDFKIKTVVTVHDCIPWTDKRYRLGVLSQMYHKMTKRALKNAAFVLTVSESSKKDIADVCSVDAKVVYDDVSAVYRGKVSDDASSAIMKKYNLEKEKYLLYCGGFDVRKNVAKLISEYEKFADEYSDVSLVLAGGKVLDGYLYDSFDKVESKNGHIVKTGFLQEKELAALYQNCLGFAHLSEKEGFNIPIVEAAASRAPLILSDTLVHREIAGNMAQFVNDDAASAMKNLVTDRDKWADRSAKIAGKFSWKKSAQQVKDMLS